VVQCLGAADVTRALNRRAAEEGEALNRRAAGERYRNYRSYRNYHSYRSPLSRAATERSQPPGD